MNRGNSHLTTAAVIQAADGRFLMFRRHRSKSLGETWEFAGGKTRPGEQAKAALERELSEELALTVSVGRCLGTIEFQNGDRRYTLAACRVHLADDWQKHIRLKEHSHYCWVTAAEAELLPIADSDRRLLRKLTGRQQADVR